MVLGWASFSLKTLSITDNSVLVVSRPQKAHQSFTTIPAAITSLPRFTVPACQVMAQCGSWHQQPKSLPSLIRALPKPCSLTCSPNPKLSWLITQTPKHWLKESALSGDTSQRTRTLTTRGTWRREDSSSWSSTEVLGCTSPPWLLKIQ